MFLNLLFKQWKHVPLSNILKKVSFMNTLYALTTPGVIITQVPVYISEIAPKGIRGGLATSNQVREIGSEVPLIIFM
jgi:methyl coenzyme M reductase subunit C